MQRVNTKGQFRQNFGIPFFCPDVWASAVDSAIFARWSGKSAKSGIQKFQVKNSIFIKELYLVPICLMEIFAMIP